MDIVNTRVEKLSCEKSANITSRQMPYQRFSLVGYSFLVMIFARNLVLQPLHTNSSFVLADRESMTHNPCCSSLVAQSVCHSYRLGWTPPGTPIVAGPKLRQLADSERYDHL